MQFLKKFLKNGSNAFIFCILFLFANFTYAQTKIPTKKVKKITNQLNNFEIPQALRAIQKLIDDEPYSPYYNEMQASVLQQIILKIAYAKEESEATVQTSYLDTDKKIVQDTLDWENESDSAMLQFERPTTNDTNSKNMVIGNSTTSNKPTAKKKKKWFQFVDDTMEVANTSTSYIDTNYAKNGEASDDANDGVTMEDVDKIPVSSNDGGAPAGFQKTTSRQAKQKARAEEIRNGYATMDKKVYINQLIASARLSTLYVEYADSASKYLREYLVDTFYSRRLWKDSALALVESGDEHLDSKEFEEALTDYNAAMIIEPDLVSAYLKMGDAYMLLGEDSMGNLYYETAFQLDSTSPNVSYHIAQFYFKKGSYHQALVNVVDAILIYPDKMFFDMIKDIANKTAADYVSQWVPRFVYPISTKNNFEALVVDDKNPWFYYQAAKSDYASYANENGIMRFNELTNERYLEVACFLRMLDSTKKVKELQFAREIASIGYADCYALVSLFHIDNYAQFKDFAKRNPKKIRVYLYILLNWHKHKFDKIREIEKKVEEEEGKKKKKLK
jgi:TPR repeat